MRRHSQRQRGPALFLVLTVGVLAISSAAVLIRLADAPALVVAAYRTAVASLLLGPGLVVTQRRQLAALSPRSLAWMVVSGAFLALHFGFWIASLSYTSVASSVVLVTSSPLLVAMASWLLLQERPHRREMVGIALGVLGGAVVAGGDLRLGAGEFRGDLLALAGAGAAAGYLLIGRRTRARESVFTYTAVVYPVAAMLLVATALGTGNTFAGYPPATYLWLTMVALVPQMIGHTSLNWVLGHLTATAVAIAIMAEPVVASILAWVVLKEAPPLTTVAGGVLILLGVYLALHRPPVRGPSL